MAVADEGAAGDGTHRVRFAMARSPNAEYGGGVPGRGIVIAWV
jgi:hypothetical protein